MGWRDENRGFSNQFLKSIFLDFEMNRCFTTKSRFYKILFLKSCTHAEFSAKKSRKATFSRSKNLYWVCNLVQKSDTSIFVKSVKISEFNHFILEALLVRVF